MQAIIFADRLGGELKPLCEHVCPALLPLANRPLLEYTLDDLAHAGVKEALIVISRNASQIESHFGNGEMWGMLFRYILSRGEESPRVIMQRTSALLKPPFLALRGDVYRSQICAEFINWAQIADGQNIEATICHQRAAVYLVHEATATLPSLNWRHRNSSFMHLQVDCGEGQISMVDTYASFHRASLTLIESDKCANPLRVCKMDQNVSIGRLSKFNSDNHEGGKMVIGEQVKIDPGAKLKGPLVIGDRCYIDYGANIQNSIVFPGTYIGEGLTVENAIVTGSHLIRIDLGSAIPVGDPLLLSDIETDVNSILAPLPERILGAFILLLSLPLWPVAFILSFLQNSGRVFSRLTVLSNHIDILGQAKEVTAITFNTFIPLFHKLPMLWLVACGDLRLFGSEPLLVSNQSSSLSNWDPRKETRAAGLIGPAQLNLPSNAPEEEIRLNEMVFIKESGLFTLLRRLLKAGFMLISMRAWQTNHFEPQSTIKTECR